MYLWYHFFVAQEVALIHIDVTLDIDHSRDRDLTIEINELDLFINLSQFWGF